VLSHKVLTRQSTDLAAGYYEDGADDYYAKSGEASAWQGRGAATLGLSGPVEAKRFRELLAGCVEPGKPVARGSTRQDSHSRIGIDLTFSAPKSVSIQALLGGDVGLVLAHDTAVARTVAVAEEQAQTRLKVAGKSSVQNTGNLIVARFRHETSRDHDPQLHTHAVLLNLTQRQDGQWRALRNDQIVKATKYLGAVYRAELAAEVNKLGYAVRHEGNGMFELAQFSRAQLEQFSRRSAQIEAALAKDGLTRETATTAQKQRATLATRKAKDIIDRKELFQQWKERAANLKLSLDRPTPEAQRNGLADSRDPVQDEALRRQAAKDAVKYAVHHLTERQAIVTRSELLDTAINHGVALVTLPDVEREIARRVERHLLIEEATVYRWVDNPKMPARMPAAWTRELRHAGLSAEEAQQHVAEALKNGRLVADEPRYTTPKAVEREETILRVEREGRDRLAPPVDQDLVATRLQASGLSAEQQKAVELITTNRNRVINVQGFAGTGKSHMLDAATSMLEEAGYKVTAAAPYAGQVRSLRKLGVDARTVASILSSRNPEKYLGPRSILVVDEAGVVPARIMSRVLTLAESTGTRVVLLGDTEQTKAIEAGRPFAQLQNSGALIARLEDIKRQTNASLKRAVELGARGDTARSLCHVDDIREIRNDHDRRLAVADTFARLDPAARERTLIVSGTNEARREINDLVRQKVGTDGKGYVYDTLTRLDTTQAQRMFAKYYAVGSRIQPERDYPRVGLERGELYEVVENGPTNHLTVRGATEKTIQFNPLLHRKLSVYEVERTELAPGDRVRFTRNNASLDLANGERAIVKSVSPEKVVLSLEKREVELSADRALHLDLAYATTVHSSQGMTADRVLVDLSTTSRTTSKDVYYVAISRARQEAIIFTDQMGRLPAAVSRENVKHAALDLKRAEVPALARENAKTHEHELGG
jgi:conjugative relaxase-like TrwC/TraI family protein